MYIETGTIVFGYIMGKNDFMKDIKGFGDKINFFKKKQNNFEELVKRYKKKDFFFGDTIDMEAYNLKMQINTLEGGISIGEKTYKIVEDDESFIETVKFTDNEILIEIKSPGAFWHTTVLKIPYGILFHPEFLSKFKEKNQIQPVI